MRHCMRPAWPLTAGLLMLLCSYPLAALAAESSVGQADANLVSDEVTPGQGELETATPPAPFDPSFYQPLPLPASIPPPSNPRLRPPGEIISFDTRTGAATRGGLAPELQSGLEEAMRSGALGDLFTYPDLDAPTPLEKNFTGLSWVSNTTTGRYPTHVKLFMNVRDVNGVLRGFVCSGTLIDPQHVITAGHCVYFHTDNNGNVYNNWAESIRVVPAYNNGAEPYGDANGVQFHSWTGWTVDENFDHDIGIIDLDRPVGALTGWRGYGWYGSCGSFTGGAWEHNGYPAASPFNGQFMYHNSGTFDSCETVLGIWTGNEVRFNNQSWGGQSGSGAVRSDAVRAVLSNGTSSYTDDVRITEGKYGTIGTWISQDVPASVDLVALDVNAAPATVNSGSPLSTLNFLVHNYSSVSWSGTINYDVYLSTNNFISTGDTKISTQSVSWSFTSKSSVRVNAVLPTIPASMTTGSYYVGVIITNTDANTSNNDSSFDDAAPINIVCPTPSTATLFSPSNGASCLNTTVSLDWSTVANATSYQVQVGSSCGTGSTFTTSSSIFSYSTTAGVTRFWRVRARNACGVWGPWTGCRSFSTAPPAPATPALLVPATGSTCVATSVTLDWGNVANAGTYQLQYGSTCGTGTVLTVGSSAATVSVATNTVYFWRVRARTSCGSYGAWSGCFKFTTRPNAPASPVLASPANGATCQPLAGTLNWNAVAGATSYQVQMGSVCGSGSIVTTSSTSWGYSGVPANSTRLWRVRARNACGTYSAWSGCYSFSTSQAPIGVGPDILSSSPTSSQKILVVWNKDLDPASSQVAANYFVHETGNPANSIAVGSAVLSAPAQVTLVLAAPWDPAFCYTIEAQNVQDLCGNFNGIDTGSFSASFAATQGGQILICPGGDGDKLITVGSEILYSARDAAGNPISGLTAADFVLDGCDPLEIAMCSTGLPAFSETPAGSGDYLFTGAPAAGGWTNRGLSLQTSTQCVSNSCLRILTRSPDITADGVSDLVDVGEFAVQFFAGGPSADMNFDNALDLVDVGLFAPHVGHGPCTVLPPGPALASGQDPSTEVRLALSYARDAVITEMPADADPASGITVYLVARSPIALGAWQAEIEVAPGLVVSSRSALASPSLDVDDDADRWRVGFGQPVGGQRSVVALASYELSVIDDREAAATIRIRGDHATELPPAYAAATSSPGRVVSFVIENSSLELRPQDVTPIYAGPSAILSVAPNPFNPSTEIRFHLEESTGAQLRIYDVTGRLVRSVDVADLGRGQHAWTWRGQDHRGRAVASGVYVVRLVARDHESVQRITLMK